MSNHQLYKFSVTVETHDLAVVACLRSLAEHSQKTVNNRIPWGGTKEPDWRRSGHRVTFHFSTPEYRKGFLSEITRLLPASLFAAVAESDDDPAKSQSR